MTVSLMERLDVEVETLDSLFGIDAARLPEPADEFRERGAELRLAWAAAVDWPPAINLLRARTASGVEDMAGTRGGRRRRGGRAWWQLVGRGARPMAAGAAPVRARRRTPRPRERGPVTAKAPSRESRSTAAVKTPDRQADGVCRASHRS